jgi:medium-chain acyl-[acyl-carrier-protein] hydrolase
MNERPRSSPWILRTRRNPNARLRLICFAFAGAGASAFRAWHALVPDWIEVGAVQLPGRESRIREAPYRSIPELVPALAAELLDDAPAPFAMFGHSMGALIAFEVCRFLRSRAQGPMELFVSAHAAPQIPFPGPYIHQLPDAHFVQELRRYRGTPEAVLQSSELLAMVLPSLRADFTMMETYRYERQEPFSFPITAFAGHEDVEAPAVLIEPWREQTTADFELVTLPGDHFFLHTARDQLLHAIIARLEGRSGRPARP